MISLQKGFDKWQLKGRYDLNKQKCIIDAALLQKMCTISIRNSFLQMATLTLAILSQCDIISIYLTELC